MTAVNPPFALQNAGATHTAENDRMMLASNFAGTRAAASLTGRGGVSYVGSQLKVQAQGSPAMAVDVLNGHIYIPGTESVKQGVYSCTNDATVVLSIAAAHATLPRIDIVVAKVQDTAYSGGSDTWSLVVVTGTPAGSPVAPTTPANALVLAQILVGAAVTSIVNGNITDTRIWAAGAGGVIQCTSTTRPGTTTVPFGQMIYETDTGLPKQLHTDSTWFPLRPLFARKTADESVTSSTTLQNDDHLTLSLEANAVYVIEAGLIWVSPGGTGIDAKFAYAFPTPATWHGGGGVRNPETGTNPSSNDFGTYQNVTGSPTGVFTTGLITSVLQGRNNALIIVGGTPGSLTIQWAQQTSSASAATLKAGSYLMATRVA